MHDAWISFLFTHDDEELCCDRRQLGENSLDMTKTEWFFPEIHRRGCFGEIRRFIVRTGEIRLGRRSIGGSAKNASDERLHLRYQTRLVRFDGIAVIDKDEEQKKGGKDENRNRTLTRVRRCKTKRKEKN